MKSLKTQLHKPIHLIISSLLLVIVLVAWVGSMLRAPFFGPHQEQLQQVIVHWPAFQLIFGIALAIAPVFIYFSISLYRYLSEEISLAAVAGFTLAAFYLLFVSGAYGAQLVVLPYYLSREMTAMAEVWFFYNPESLVYFINQTGYALWAVAVLLLFGSEVKKKGARRWLAGFFIMSALLSLAAYGGLLLDQPLLNMLTLASGALTLPIAVLAFGMAAGDLHKRETKESAAPETNKSEEAPKENRQDPGEQHGQAAPADRSESSEKPMHGS